MTGNLLYAVGTVLQVIAFVQGTSTTTLSLSLIAYGAALYLYGLVDT